MGKQKKADIRPARLLIDRVKQAQAVDEILKPRVDTANIHSECKIWRFVDII